MRKMTALMLCLFILLAGVSPITVLADELPVKTFSADVELLRQENDNYVMQVTATNKGEDFTGTVQVVFSVSAMGNCAYNTEITLPAQGKKQFTITAVSRAVDTSRGSCTVNFLDEKGRVLQTIPLDHVFGNTLSNISVGILSDNFSGLTFMDAGGRDFMIRGMEYPLELTEVDPERLKEQLPGLFFLVIDQFNVSSLDEESIQAIQDWTKDGGWLILGTGAHAQETLSGFTKDFIDVGIRRIYEPGEENPGAVNMSQYGYYYGFIDAGVDFEKMSFAELEYNNRGGYYLYESAEFPAIVGDLENGALSILNISLGEKELQKLGDYVIQSLYEEVMRNSSSYQSYASLPTNMDYTGKRLLAFIDGKNTSIDFTWLQVLIGVYVILAGPGLYLILRKCKKREWYWVCVPALGLLFMAGVFFFGRGARVNDTKVYSVTLQKADSDRMDTYFLAYRPGVKSWDMLLQKGYEAAGPGWDGYYRGYYSNSANYHYTVRNHSGGLSLGIVPGENFENAFLYAGGKTERKGTILGTGIRGDGINTDYVGTVTNQTSRDLDYMAVYFGESILVFSDVEAGETIDLSQAVQESRCIYQNQYVNYYDNLMYDMVGLYGSSSRFSYRQDDMAALLIGIGAALEAKPADQDPVVIVGLIRDYDKAVAEKCNEISYGCIYSYGEMEGL